MDTNSKRTTNMCFKVCVNSPIERVVHALIDQKSTLTMNKQRGHIMILNDHSSCIISKFATMVINEHHILYKQLYFLDMLFDYSP